MLEKALEVIKKFEGCRLKAYYDQGHVATVGWGCTGPDITIDTEWTQEKADTDLTVRVLKLKNQMAPMLKVTLTENQMAAFLSLAYNIGIGGFSKSSALAAANAGNFGAAADDILKWDKIGHVVNAGLAKRRAAERTLFLTP